MSTSRTVSSRTSRKSALDTGKFKKPSKKKETKPKLKEKLFLTIQAFVHREDQYKVK